MFDRVLNVATVIHRDHNIYFTLLCSSRRVFSRSLSSLLWVDDNDGITTASGEDCFVGGGGGGGMICFEVFSKVPCTVVTRSVFRGSPPSRWRVGSFFCLLRTERIYGFAQPVVVYNGKGMLLSVVGFYFLCET